MNISKPEQRVLHVLAQGGVIDFDRATNGHVTNVICYTREGYVLSDLNLAVFKKLKKRRLIISSKGKPYQISRKGRISVRAQLDNR
ncbi:YjhX family toxin [Terasakiella sp. A23]|uniref:YjhX family toxin n=1 Tax=Terasakiella sp. FCG-A23 TaxID=3080561 RepID=UPI002954D2E9|nr:YjhX family toxin [Terasakiella sp. A23]MDV7340205.1 YjhX family toxin [Terasakiella sp. A23]